MPGNHSLFTSRFVLALAGLVASVMAGCPNESVLTLTDVAMVSSLASCATYSGGIHVANVTETIDLTGIETIVGGIYCINKGDFDITIHSSSLKSVTRGLNFFAHSSSDVESATNLYLSLPALESTSYISISGYWWILSLNTSPNLNISEDFYIFPYSNILFVNRTFDVLTADSFTVVSIGTGGDEPLLSSPIRRVESSLFIASNDNMEALLLNDLDFRGTTAIEDNGRSTFVSLPKLEKLGYGINEPDGDGHAGGVFRHLLNISLPLLKEAHESSRKNRSEMSFTSNHFPELSLPRLEIANCTFNISGNFALKNLWIPRLNYTKELEIHGNPQLLNFTANFLRKAESINITGAFTNVEFFSLELVTGNFYLAGDETMDCSWLDERMVNGIVKGMYKCVGNHTNPVVERKPSTPTDESQLEAWESGNSEWREYGTNDESQESQGGGGSLSKQAKDGISGGVTVAVLVAMAAGAWLFILKYKKSKGTATTAMENIAELHGESGVSRAPDRRTYELDANNSQVEEPLEITRS